MESPETAFRVASPTGADLDQAIQLAFQRLSPESRDAQAAVVDDALSATPPRGRLATLYRGEQLIGAIWAQLLPGSCALVWPPRVTDDDPAAADRLLSDIDDWLALWRVELAQVSLSEDELEDRRRLEHFGYEFVASLAYLSADRSTFPVEAPTGDPQFEEYDESKSDRLRAIIDMSYEQSLDCPAIDGMRSLDDVIKGYRQTGVYAPERWKLLTYQGNDVGCLLLTDHPKLDQWELIYMGLKPAARGRGWGRLMARHAQWLTGRAGRARLVLAVDEQNSPAIAAYSRCQFALWQRRSVLIRRPRALKARTAGPE